MRPPADAEAGPFLAMKDMVADSARRASSGDATFLRREGEALDPGAQAGEMLFEGRLRLRDGGRADAAPLLAHGAAVARAARAPDGLRVALVKGEGRDAQRRGQVRGRGE